MLHMARPLQIFSPDILMSFSLSQDLAHPFYSLWQHKHVCLLDRLSWQNQVSADIPQPALRKGSTGSPVDGAGAPEVGLGAIVLPYRDGPRVCTK